MNNRKKNGFTLIELLGCVVILGLILVIVYPSLRGSTDDANNKNEEIFKSRLTSSIETYISLNSSSISVEDTGKTITKSDDSLRNIKVFRSNPIPLQAIVDDKIVSAPIINSSNKNKECSLTNNQFTVYKDEDYVYCFYMVMASDDCISGTNKIINTCSKELSIVLEIE